MKKILIPLLIAGLFAGSCARKKEKRDEYKAENSKDEKRNAGVDSAALSDPDRDTVQAVSPH
ncbi:hypothetical protein [Chryseobacterium sp.]|uniref:hypothetical protein n=1 Tax=Chryseobacterium sp. TaxID=1871047 RepID=UPI0011C9B73E|nr:hypothetical protein [Chryseobacterium sp.]TXF74942.1 hypothetical protein FUA25_11695 [Chryseobacterium sp.]